MSSLRFAQCLLPRNATPLELRVSMLGSRLDSLPVTFTRLHDIDLCPVPFLPWLAWSHRVEYWSPDWPESRKRQTIRDAKAANATKGTRAGLNYALGQVMPGGYSLQPWHSLSPAGAPYSFVISIQPPERLLSIAELADIQRVTESAKSARDTFAIRAHVAALSTTYSGGAGFAGERVIFETQP